MHDVLERTASDVKGLTKHFVMVQTQLRQITKVQIDLFAETFKKDDKHAFGITTRGGASTQDPLYTEGHPKRIEQESQLAENNIVVPPKKKKKKKKHKEVRETNELGIDEEPVLENPNNISISDAETEDDNELVNDIDKDNEPNKEGSDVEPERPPKNRSIIRKNLLLGSMVAKGNLGCKSLCLSLTRIINQRKKGIIINSVSG